MKSILVTGGAGYVGSHACKALALAGYTPITFDNLVYGHKSAVKWGPLVEGDLINKELLRATIDEYKPLGVFHFAAFTYVGESVHDPVKYYRNNVYGTMQLLEAMIESGLEKIVFSSTCATYGEPCSLPITEDEKQAPMSPYGMTKLTVERILKDYKIAYALKPICLRYFNAAGADPDLEIGERHDPESHLIPLAIEAIVKRRTPFRLFGTDYSTPDGTCIRDYIHVSDLAAISHF